MTKREKNYKIGWVLPNQVAGLTHFHADVTMDDMQGVVTEGTTLIDSVAQIFHIIIDNRVVGNTQRANLKQMKQFVPYMSNPFLRWVVVVLPEASDVDPKTISIEQDDDTQLIHVHTLDEAINHLKSIDSSLDWTQSDADFFPHYQIL